MQGLAVKPRKGDAGALPAGPADGWARIAAACRERRSGDALTPASMHPPPTHRRTRTPTSALVPTCCPLPSCAVPLLASHRPTLPPTNPHAVLFFSLRTEGVLDKGSLHGSCPTTKGTK